MQSGKTVYLPWIKVWKNTQTSSSLHYFNSAEKYETYFKPRASNSVACVVMINCAILPSFRQNVGFTGLGPSASFLMHCCFFFYYRDLKYCRWSRSFKIMFFWRMLLHSCTFSHNVTFCKCNNGTKLTYEMYCLCCLSCSWVIAYHENKVCKLGFIIFKTCASVRYVQNLLDIVLLLRQSTFLTKCKIKSEVVVSKHFP